MHFRRVPPWPPLYRYLAPSIGVGDHVALNGTGGLCQRSVRTAGRSGAYKMKKMGKTIVVAVAGWLVISGSPLLGASSESANGELGQGLIGPAPAARDPKLDITGYFTVAPGGQTGHLYVQATMPEGWYIYSLTQPAGGPIRTRIRVDASDAFELAGQWTPDEPPHRKKSEAFGGLMVETHAGRVTWSVPIRLRVADPAKLRITGSVVAQRCNADTCLPPRSFPFTAELRREGLGPGRAQAPQLGTDDASGLGGSVPPQQGAEPSLPGLRPPSEPSVGSSGGGSPESSPAAATPENATMAGEGFDPEQLRANIARQKDRTTLAQAIVFGLLGGLILNIMPCVLPVIGLKILSFMEQAGRNRLEALMLNVWYSLGLLLVWLLLATLVVVAQLGLGEIFQKPGFNVVLAAVVFAMALSFLGVWEVPIPGFAAGGGVSRLAEREGLAGALAKGVLTTILATPCVGPFMGSAVAWSVSQPPLVTYAVFASVGLGMASPYLLIGAFPWLIRFLPKPGAWMVTFQNVMGFVLLGTVVYLFTFLEISYVVPTVGMLVAVWAACWWIARTPLTAPLGVKLRTWGEVAAFLGVAWLLLFPGVDEMFSGRWAFGGLHDVMKARVNRLVEQRASAEVAAMRKQLAELTQTLAASGTGGTLKPEDHRRLQDLLRSTVGKESRHRSGNELPWQPFTTQAEFKKLLDAGHTVLVDFTADWCATCKTLEAAVLNTPEVREAVRRNGVVAVQADWTHEAPEISAMLDLLGGRQVPTIAIFPAGRPNQPIIFRGGYTKQRILEALEQAGPSRSPATAMR